MLYSLQLENITDETEFKDLINSDEYDFRFTCGVTHRLSPFVTFREGKAYQCLLSTLLYTN